MKQSKVEKVVKLIPDVLKETGNYLKDSSNNVFKSVASNNGTIGLVVKIFGQPLIDRYFKKIERNKLSNFGIYTYLEASLTQIATSIEATIPNLNQEYSTDGLIIGFEKAIDVYTSQIESVDYVLFFQPKYHPIVNKVYSIAEEFLLQINIEEKFIKAFRQKYFDEIDVQIVKSFGSELYTKHLKEIEGLIFKDNETRILNDNLELGKIGFKENEVLSYEETFASWQPVSSLYTKLDSLDNKEVEKDVLAREDKLSKIEELIDTYFHQDSGVSIEKVLFVVADFGKGKSVFLKHYTSALTKLYIYDSSKYFPVYFNLRNYKDYQEEHPLGIIGNYLEVKYGIKLTEDYYINKRFFFLIDSLDESGDLNSYNIDRVIASVKKIQNLNPIISKFNRIIITTRPFDDGLRKHLEGHRPFLLLNSEKRPIEYFISLYGFKKSQFNNWLTTSLKNNLPNTSRASGLNKEILSAVEQGTPFDFHNTFSERGIISFNELRRPIFAYMIFQLISNSIEFEKAGKIGIYLSFLNLLTKEAKYVHDVNYKINLVEQFEARNILHSTAAVWLYNRSSWNKSEIKKADICRALEGESSFESDVQILNRYKETNAAEIQFLSHSYFGENNNTLHFQHQSFGEILLAEYYLKILIKYSFDEEFDYESARIKLTIGKPTSQSIEFFVELLVLLRESTEPVENSLEKRKLLFPLLASLATRRSNKTLYCNNLFYTWYSHIKFNDNSSDFPVHSLANWPVNIEKLEKICELSRKILSTDTTLSIQTGEFKTSLFNKEVFLHRLKLP